MSVAFFENLVLQSAGSRFDAFFFRVLFQERFTFFEISFSHEGREAGSRNGERTANFCEGKDFHGADASELPRGAQLHNFRGDILGVIKSGSTRTQANGLKQASPGQARNERRPGFEENKPSPNGAGQRVNHTHCLARTKSSHHNLDSRSIDVLRSATSGVRR